jgi:hypothetical protein
MFFGLYRPVSSDINTESPEQFESA